VKKVALIILDGWGLGKKEPNNAIHMAETPFFDYLWDNFPHTKLHASGEAVGLPEGQIGGSEVGHLTIGAGKVLYQELSRINKSLQKTLDLLQERTVSNEDMAGEDLMENHNFLDFLNKSKINPAHLIGLVSPGGVHSHQDHLFSLLEIMKLSGCKSPFIHVISDGRDTPPCSGIESARKLISKVNELQFGNIVTLSGRFFTMDRDKNRDRTEKGLSLITKSAGQGDSYNHSNLADVFSELYSADFTDEFIEPVVIDSGYQGLKQEEPVLFFNFRSDRMKQIVQKLHEYSSVTPVFTMTAYDKDFVFAKPFFEKQKVQDTLGEIIANSGLNQSRFAETEKFPHVTYFFNGGVEVQFDKEERMVAPSNKVLHDQSPEMKASEITQSIISDVEGRNPEFILVNYANPDMVGHTGNFKAVVEAVEKVDNELKKLCEFLTVHDYTCVILADHGNADYMFDLQTKEPHTAHTMAKVPFVIYHPDIQGISLNQDEDLGLSNVAGTVLKLMGIESEHTENAMF
jgi:2,3-bisphosphoglycerate-independent phosphoglycerate mutase